jgi:hypothetical protein
LRRGRLAGGGWAVGFAGAVVVKGGVIFLVGAGEGVVGDGLPAGAEGIEGGLLGVEGGGLPAPEAAPSDAKRLPRSAQKPDEGDQAQSG